MKRHKNLIEERQRIVKLAIEDPKAAASEIKELANELEKCQNTTRCVAIIATILKLSEVTIWKDYQRTYYKEA